MAAPVFKGIDWLHWMRVYALNDPGLFDQRLPNEWIVAECEMAVDIALTECPFLSYRARKGWISEATFAGIICGMVLRVARWQRFKTESNGVYSYTEHDPQSLPPGYDASPSLYLSKREKSLLEGSSSSGGPIGTVHMGLDRLYGM